MPYPNKFRCFMCFQILDLSECALHDGKKIDVCNPCIEIEKAVMINKEELT